MTKAHSNTVKPKLRPFYIDNTTLTSEQREDLYKRCVAAGAGRSCFLNYPWFGVDEELNIVTWSHETTFTNHGVPKITYSQVWEYLGEDPPAASKQYRILTLHHSGGDIQNCCTDGSIVELMLKADREGVVITNSIDISEDDYNQLKMGLKSE